MRKGQRIAVQFDRAQLISLQQGGFKGFIPVITGINQALNPLAALGITSER